MSSEALRVLDPDRNYISMVPAGRFPEEVLKKIVPLLDRVVAEEHDQTIETVLMDLFRGDSQIWVVNNFEAVLVTKIFTRGIKKILSIELMAGDNVKGWREDWIDTETRFARANHCDRVEFATARNCRRAVARLHPGFKPQYTVYRRDVT